MATATEIYGWFKDFFDSNDLCYTEEENDIITIQMPIKCKLRNTFLLLACIDDHVCVKALAPLKADEASRANVLEYLMRANYGMLDGCFEMDMSDGEITFRVSLTCEDRTSLSEELIAKTFMLPQFMLIRYGDGLIDVLFGVKTPEEAIVDIEGEHDCSSDSDSDLNDGEAGEALTVFNNDGKADEASALINDENEAYEDTGKIDESPSDYETMCLCDKDCDVIEVLYDTPDLRGLCMQNCGIDDISVLANLSKLETARLSGNEISDLTPLAALTNLKELRIGDNQISDLSPLAELLNLKSLCVCNNQVDDISALSGLTALEGLCICFQQIEDISALEGMVNMSELHLEGNQIEDLSPLASMVNLKKLNMVGNRISDISPLYGLKSLKHLDLSDNDISEEQALEFSRRNPDCELYLVSVDTM
jgi:hypothetical protein